MNKLHPIQTLLILCILSLLFQNCQQNTMNSNDSKPNHHSKADTAYNAELAKKLGADDYGMKKYVMAFLKKGPNRDLSPDSAATLQRAHLDNIRRLAEMGKLSVAGPFFDDGDIRGIYIFNVESVEEAKTLTETDPAIQAGSLVMELRPWYGSAAVQMINEWHQTISKEHP